MIISCSTENANINYELWTRYRICFSMAVIEFLKQYGVHLISDISSISYKDYFTIFTNNYKKLKRFHLEGIVFLMRESLGIYTPYESDRIITMISLVIGKLRDFKFFNLIQDLAFTEERLLFSKIHRCFDESIRKNYCVVLI